MRIICKQKDEYFVKMSEEELRVIVFGERYPQYNKNTEASCRAFFNRIESAEYEVKVCERYGRMLDLANIKVAGERDSIIDTLESIIELFRPVESFIKAAKKDTEEKNGDQPK